jgi:hypothetical protein
MEQEVLQVQGAEAKMLTKMLSKLPSKMLMTKMLKWPPPARTQIHLTFDNHFTLQCT